MVTLALSVACFVDPGPEQRTTSTGEDAATAVSTATDATAAQTTGMTTSADTTGVTTGESTSAAETTSETTAGTTTGCEPVPCYPDGDGDGVGADAEPVMECACADGYAPTPGDCDDADGANLPGNLETCDGGDNNCNGVIDEWSEMNDAACGACFPVAPMWGRYLWFCDDPQTWDDARARCSQLGADLVTLDTQEQSMSLIGLSPGPTEYWIGLTDAVEEGSFRWVDDDAPLGGEAFWQPGEPTQIGDEDCVQTSGDAGMWNDLVCAGISSRYICEARVR